MTNQIYIPPSQQTYATQEWVKNYIQFILNSIGESYLPLSGGTMNGDITLASNNSYNLGSSADKWKTFYSTNISDDGTDISLGNISSDLVPSATTTYNLGNSSDKWNTFYSTNISDDGTNITLGSVSSNILPSANNTYTLGSSSFKWKNLYTPNITDNGSTVTLGTIASSLSPSAAKTYNLGSFTKQWSGIYTSLISGGNGNLEIEGDTVFVGINSYVEMGSSQNITYGTGGNYSPPDNWQLAMSCPTSGNNNLAIINNNISGSGLMLGAYQRSTTSGTSISYSVTATTYYPVFTLDTDGNTETWGTATCNDAVNISGLNSAGIVFTDSSGNLTHTIADFSSHNISPATTNAYKLGDSSHVWTQMYAEKAIITGTSNIFGGTSGLGMHTFFDGGANSGPLITGFSSETTKSFSLLSFFGIDSTYEGDQNRTYNSVTTYRKLNLMVDGSFIVASGINTCGITPYTLNYQNILYNSVVNSNDVNNLLIASNSNTASNFLLSCYSTYSITGATTGTINGTTMYRLFYVNNNGDITVYGALNTPSDEKLKKDIKPARSYLQDINNLKVSKFNWKNDENADQENPKNLGFIAQDIENVFPKLISKDENETKMINWPVLIPMLVTCIQDLSKQIQQLQTTIQQQQTTIDDLVKHIKGRRRG